MDINEFMTLIRLTRNTKGKDWTFNRRLLRLKLRYLIDCDVKKLHKHIVMPSLLEIDFNKMRKAKGLTLREVEKSTGISNAYLSQLETGKIKSPGYTVVKALLELYSNEA